jgi:hypothetical protein
LKLEHAFKLVEEVANPSNPEGLKQPRAVLLLWVLQNVLGLDPLDAYEHVCDGTNDQGIDGLRREEAEVVTDGNPGPDTLLLMQSKFPEKAKNVGENDLKHFVGAAAGFEGHAALESLLKGKLERELRHLIGRYDVLAGLKKKNLATKLLFVTAGELTAEARRYAANLNKTRGPGFLTCYDALDLAPLIEAFKAPKPVKGKVTIPCLAGERFVSGFTGGRVAVGAVSAKDIVAWPGIDDRRLFELNVRRELRANSVRKALDRAIEMQSDHEFFLAFHNGLTVVCEKIDDASSEALVVTNMSVVNGAQSTVAFRANQASITPGLKVVVKFVEVNPTHKVARQVALRSNQQNPVNARNLRARDGVQLRLEAEFRTQFPGVTYETRPDVSLGSKGHVIANDDAAQVLCAVYNQKPWLAVKRLSLFDPENYPSVFGANVSAAHVVLCDFIAGRVGHHASLFPVLYRRTWLLTRLVAVYLVGQLLRSNEKLNASILNNPRAALTNRKKLGKTVDQLVKFAAAALVTRADAKKQSGELDDFKVDFKREDALKDLAKDARKSYLTHLTVSA